MLTTEFLSKLKKLDLQDLMSIKGVGPILAENYIEFLNSTRFQKLYEKFKTIESLEMGLDIVHKKMDTKNLPLSGQIICITGVFDVSRNKIKELLENKGAKVVDSITAITTALLAGDKSGSKLEKAKKLDITIINDYNQLIDS